MAIKEKMDRKGIGKLTELLEIFCVLIDLYNSHKDRVLMPQPKQTRTEHQSNTNTTLLMNSEQTHPKGSITSSLLIVVASSLNSPQKR